MSSDLSQAKKLIQECLETQNPYLDLGNCGITNLNDLPELLKCVHLETLNFSSVWFEWKDLKHKRNTSQNNGKPNQIQVLSKDIGQLTKLQNLILYNVLHKTKVKNLSLLSDLSQLKSLDLRFNKITDISFLEKLTALQSLYLSDNQIADYSFLEKLTTLQSLELRFNKITDYSFLEKLTALQSLDLRYNKITDISFLEKLTTLQSLDLSDNQITDISFLEKLTALQSLDLRFNKITDISFLEKLTALQSLDLSSNQITDISFLEKLTALQSLYLNSNQITDISFLEKLTALQSLYLRFNKITDISFLEKLTALQSLYLSSNKITDISFLEKLTALQSLYLSSNKITDYSFLEKLTALQSLDLSSNQITDYSFLEKLTALQSLDLNDNQITDISFLEKLTALQSLNLRFNKITDISFLEKLTALQSLNLRFNKITDYSFLEKLTALQSLDLSSNKITDYSFLEKLTALQSLDLSDNQITDISFLEKLIALQSLDLSDNQITDIPIGILEQFTKYSFKRFHSGKGLNIYNNPIESPPIEILKQGYEAVQNWVKAEKQALNEIKVILIGDPKAGKTSILKRLVDNSFSEKEAQTDGINIEAIEFVNSELFKEESNLHQFTGYFWDFGGQEIMNATHQFFLTKRSVYLLVLDARKDKDISSQIRTWSKRITATGGNSPIIVIANQIDVNPGFGFENEFELKQEFPQIQAFITVSCKEGTNLDLLAKTLAEFIPKAELFNTQIDKRWLQLKDQLQEETGEIHFLTESRFLEICRKYELDKKLDQSSAIQFLHDLGLVLHFKELDQDLAEYYVMDPYWITYGVYQIVTSIEASKRKGEVPMDRLEYIINEEKDKSTTYQPKDKKPITYSTNERRFLVDILHQFKLCYYFPDRKGFILPTLLETSEPENETLDIRSQNDTIKFIYQYSFLPTNILPYVMVESNKIMSHKWRTGCILTNGHAKALISAYEDRLTITVTGDHKRKREFMSIVRYLINSINRKFEVNPKMLIPLPGINQLASYNTILNMEKLGRESYEVFEPDYFSFRIDKLLEGIEQIDSGEYDRLDKTIESLGISLKGKLSAIKDQLIDQHSEAMVQAKKNYGSIEEVVSNQNVIIDIMDSQEKMIRYLCSQPSNQELQQALIEEMQKMSDAQTNEIVEDTIQMIETSVSMLGKELDENLQVIYDKITKTDDPRVKLKLATPLLNLTGVGIEAEFDLKSWAQKMYEKYGWRYFKLMGYLE